MTPPTGVDAPRIIGVDFDNTVISYAATLKAIALERGLISAQVAESKKQIRDQVRLLPNGEIEWQKLQAVVYGARIGEAKLIDGVQRFFELCTVSGSRIYVISHKTEFAGYDETRTNLRQSALEWMEANRFFDVNGLGLTPESIFFGSTRQAKIDLIVKLGCTHFIDDLEETFGEPSFPSNVEKILYAPHSSSGVLPGIRVETSWQGIIEYFFGTNGQSRI